MPSASWANGWLTNDVVTASEFAKGVGSIYDTTLGSSAATVDVTGIVAVYAHLLVMVYARGDTAAGTTNLSMRFNNDSAGNYDLQTLSANAAAVSASEAFAATQAYLGDMPANTAAANLFTTATVLIPHYAGSANNKNALVQYGRKVGTASTSITVGQVANSWRSNAAINRITLLPAAGNFQIGTRVTIYAMGA